MQDLNKIIDVNLNIPKEEKESLTIAEFFRILIHGCKTIVIFTLVFGIIGVSCGGFYYNLNSKPSVGAAWSITYEIFGTNIEMGRSEDGKPFNKDEIKRSEILGTALEMSGLSAKGITIEDVSSRISIEDVVPPEYMKEVEAYQKMAAANVAYLEKLASLKYNPTQFILTLREDGLLLAVEDKIGEFLESLISAYNEYLREQLSVANTQAPLTPTSKSILLNELKRVIAEEDYSIAAIKSKYILKSLEREFAKSNTTAVESFRLLQSQYIQAIMREIETAKAAKNMEELIARLRADQAINQLIYTSSIEEAKSYTELVAAHQLPPNTLISTTSNLNFSQDHSVAISEKVLSISSLAERSASNAVEALDTYNYYTHLLEIYSEAGTTSTTSPTIENLFNELYTAVSEISTVSADTSVSAVSAVSTTPYPAQAASVSRFLMIVVGLTFLGFFIGILWVFGKRLFVSGKSNIKGTQA